MAAAVLQRTRITQASIKNAHNGNGLDPKPFLWGREETLREEAVERAW
jgi:hypothetical protein